MIAAGKLAHSVTVQKTTYTVNSYGEPETTWTDVRRVWASCRSLTGGERVMAAQMQSIEDTVFEVREDDAIGIAPSMRLSMTSTEVYEITNIVPVHDERICRLYARRKVPGGSTIL